MEDSPSRDREAESKGTIDTTQSGDHQGLIRGRDRHRTLKGNAEQVIQQVASAVVDDPTRSPIRCFGFPFPEAGARRAI